MKILIAEDDFTSRSMLAAVLKKGGYDVVETANGSEAWDELQKPDAPKLAILDWMMPVMDGLEVVRRVRAIQSPQPPYIIMLTSKDEKADVISGLDAGADDYLTKPFDPGELWSRVKVGHRMVEMQERLAMQVRELEEQMEEIQEKTEQLRQKDLQLIEMDRAAGIGTLAAGIAHEINNPLSFIKSSVGFLKKSLDKMVGAVRYWDDKPVEEALLKGYQEHLAEINFDHVSTSLDKKFITIQNGITRIMKIVDSLKVFSKLDTEDIAKVAINKSIEEVIEILNIQEAKKVEFLKEFGETPLVECYPKDINQCLLHVIKNALDSLDTTGTIKIATSHDSGEKVISLRITDNGTGMSPETLQQVFTPFFTTKPVGSGTGVGLSLTERIIKRHGGRIDIESKEGEGTTVTITLPVGG